MDLQQKAAFRNEGGFFCCWYIRMYSRRLKMASEARMTDQRVIEALQEALDQITVFAKEHERKVMQPACEENLGRLGIPVKRPILANVAAGGYSHVDLFVPHSDPPVLIELKRDGDSHRVGEVCVQLPIYAQWLTTKYALTTPITKLAVFGTALQYPELGVLLGTYGIRYIIGRFSCPSARPPDQIACCQTIADPPRPGHAR
jgi:hypothetical protein